MAPNCPQIVKLWTEKVIMGIELSPDRQTTHRRRVNTNLLTLFLSQPMFTLLLQALTYPYPHSLTYLSTVYPQHTMVYPHQIPNKPQFINKLSTLTEKGENSCLIITGIHHFQWQSYSINRAFPPLQARRPSLKFQLIL